MVLTNSFCGRGGRVVGMLANNIVGNSRRGMRLRIQALLDCIHQPPQVQALGLGLFLSRKFVAQVLCTCSLDKLADGLPAHRTPVSRPRLTIALEYHAAFPRLKVLKEHRDGVMPRFRVSIDYVN